MKKIGIVTPWFGMDIPGGAEAEIRGLAVHLVETGIKLEVLTTCVKDFTSDWSVNFYKEGLTIENKVPVRRFRARKRNTYEFDKVNCKLMQNQVPLTQEEEETYIKEMVNSPELYEYMRVHLDEYLVFVFIPYMFGTTYYGMQICPEKSILIPCFHNESYIHMEIFKNLFCRIKGMIFHSQPECDLAKKVYDLSNVNTKVLGAGVDTELVYNTERFRQKYKISNPFILYAGRKDTGKKVHILLKYFSEYKKNNKSDLQLVLLGGGKIEIPVSILDEVYDLGFVSTQDKYDAYGAAMALCQSSAYESFSIVIMESWLCSRPVIVNAECEVTKYFAKDSNGGLWYDNYLEFESAVRYMEQHPEAADIMGKQGREYVMGNFSWKAVTDKYAGYFRSMDRKQNCDKIEKLFWPLELQNDLSENDFYQLLSQFTLADADDRVKVELKGYLNEAFKRFCYTFSMLPDINKEYRVFEIGGNPYFITLLIKKYTKYRIECSNFFDSSNTSFYQSEQVLVNEDGKETISIPYVNLNIEQNWYGQQVDIVCFCEVIEHMIDSPVKALLNINKMLRMGGYLVMSTPNVNRLENIARMLAGANIYDPYSGYGQYGRHNREYNKHELAQLLGLCGFKIEIMFSSNIHEEQSGKSFDVDKIMELIELIPYRNLDLGQYIFIRAKKIQDVEKVKAPEWLYRSMTDTYIEKGGQLK